jgi:SAM-dependent methyltransferase
MGNFWDERYGMEEFVYGEQPNEFFKQQLSKLNAGKIILPCDGEGRNGVHAAVCGWNVLAFDSSVAGRAKAMRLAISKNVVIDYEIGDATQIEFSENSVDVVAFIYAHFPPTIRQQIHRKAIAWLKPGGRIIIEAFNPKQLALNSGGPKEISLLYTENILQDDFKDLEIEVLESCTTELNEGKFHEGLAQVIRFVGIKRP